MTDYTILRSGYHNELWRKWQTTNTLFTAQNFIYPVFVLTEPDDEEPIGTILGQFRYGVNKLVEYLKPLVTKGLSCVLLYGVVPEENRDDTGSFAEDPNSPVMAAIKALRDNFPDLTIACDVCLCPYTSHGHCGVLTKDGVIDNDASIKRVTDVAMTYAKAGCHILAPSDMMDGRVGAIKAALRGSPLSSCVSVLGYSAKFTSALYYPFRDAVKSFPAFGDRLTDQIASKSPGLAFRPVDGDVAEGADMLVVNPGLPALDEVKSVKAKYPNHPLAVYESPGEYAMIYTASLKNWLDRKSCIVETMTSMRRAGADVIITFFAPDLVELLSNQGSP